MNKDDNIFFWIANIISKYKILKVSKLHPSCLSIKTDRGWYRLKWSKSEKSINYDRTR